MEIILIGVWFVGAAFSFGFSCVRYERMDPTETIAVAMLWPVVVLGFIPAVIGGIVAEAIKPSEEK